jgi:hypothetical protein
MTDQDQYVLELLTRYAPEFLRQAHAVRRRKDALRVIVLSLEQFDNSPLMLYVAISYAGRHGITITIPPPAQRRD